LGQWTEAAEDLAQAVGRQPNNDRLREQLGIALVASQDLAGYQRLCEETLARLDFEEYARRPWTAPIVPLLAPQGLDDYSRIIDVAQQFEDENPDNCVSHVVLGPYYYRAGQYQRAIAFASAVRLARPVPPDQRIFLAMAVARNGDLETAQEQLNLVSEADWQHLDVFQRQRFLLLMHEAEELVAAARASG
jgi:tetratricopeptide (TPR) repeat protein